VVIYSSEAYTVINNPAVIALMDIVKGNLQVHVAGAKAARLASGSNGEITQAPIKFNLIAAPNPTTHAFNLQLQTNNTSQKMQLRVMDILGRTVETIPNLSPGTLQNKKCKHG
jgi:hypothetical protein